MQLLFAILLAQVSFEAREPIILELPEVVFEQVSVTPQHILVLAPETRSVYVLNRVDGKRVYQLGGDDASGLRVPSSANWINEKFYVYDASLRAFFVWHADGTFQERINTDHELFFQINDLVPMAEGYVAATSLTRNRFLLARLDDQLSITAREYPIPDPEIAKMTPELRRSFTAVCQMAGQTLILGAQSLSNRITVFDQNLKYQRSMLLNANGWKMPRLSRLARASERERDLARFRYRFSEVVCMTAINDRVIMAGIRNLESELTYTYQCYDITKELPVSAAFETTLQFMGARGGEAYFRDPGLSYRALVPYLIR